MDNLTCLSDFILSTSIPFPSSNTFHSDLSFKPGDDLEHLSEKLFLQDGISSIYIKPHLLSSLPTLNSQIRSSLGLPNTKLLLQSPASLQTLSTHWESYFSSLENPSKPLQPSTNSQNLPTTSQNLPTSPLNPSNYSQSNSQTLSTNYQNPSNNSQTNSQNLHNNPQSLSNNPQNLSNNSQHFSNNSQNLHNNSQNLSNNSQTLPNNSQNLSNNPLNPLHTLPISPQNLPTTLPPSPNPLIHLLDPDTRDKFTHILLYKDSRNLLIDFMRKSDTRDLAGKDKQEKYIEQMNQNHSQEIEKWSLENKPHDIINSNVQIHLNKLEKVKHQFKVNFDKTLMLNTLNFKELISQEYSKVVQMPLNNSDFDVKKFGKAETSNRYKINLLLGLQNKKPFTVKILQADLYEYLKNSSQNYDHAVLNSYKHNPLFVSYREAKLRFPIDQGNLDALKLSSPVYGVNSTAIFSGLTFDSNQLLNSLKEHIVNNERTDSFTESLVVENAVQRVLKYRSDLHFLYYEEQLENALLKAVVDQGKNEVDSNKLKELIGSYVVTRHGNIGVVGTVYHLVMENSNSIYEDKEWRFFRSLFAHANRNKVRKLIIPLEALMKGKFKLATVKNVGEVSLKLMRTVRAEMNNVALDNGGGHWLKKVVLVVPRGIEDSGVMFNRVKDNLQNTFE